jgi:hypothetical protein
MSFKCGLRAVPVARKLSTEEGRQDQSFLFRRRDYTKKKRPEPRKTVLGSSPAEDDFCSSGIN